MTKISLKNAQQSPLFMFSFPQRIYYEDTDAGGIVYHGQYIKYLERARTEWLRYLGFNNSELERKFKMLWVVSEVNLNFLKPARLDDLLDISVGIESIGRVRCGFYQEVKRADEILVKARVALAIVANDSFKPIEIPGELKRKMEATCT